MALTFKLWARVEVYDDVSGNHEDLNSEICEYKVFETTSVQDLAQYIINCQQTTGNQEDGVLLELQEALKRQGYKT